MIQNLVISMNNFLLQKAKEIMYMKIGLMKDIKIKYLKYLYNILHPHQMSTILLKCSEKVKTFMKKYKIKNENYN